MTRQNRVQWFKQLKQDQAHTVSNAFDLLLEMRLDKEILEALKVTTARYIQACFGKPEHVKSEEDLMIFLEKNTDRLANRTPNGVLVPKRELESEFNDLHKIITSWIRGLGKEELITSVFCPISVRVVKGQSDLAAENRPYASTKIHADLWSGDPGDSVVVFIPILGDIARTTVEFFRPPDDFESKYLRMMSSYDEALQKIGTTDFCPYPIEMKKGFAYFADAIVLHRTVRRGGTVRVTLEFRLRRRTTEPERRLIESLCDAERLARYVGLQDWYRLGTTKKLQFRDTYADAERGIFPERPHNEPIYTVIDG